MKEEVKEEEDKKENREEFCRNIKVFFAVSCFWENSFLEFKL